MVKVKAPLVVAIIAIVAVGGAAAAFLYKPPPPKIKIGYLPAASYALIWIAYEKGFFKEEGLDVTLKGFYSIADLVKAISAGTIDGAPITAVALAAFAKQVDFVIVCGNSLDGTGLVAKPENVGNFTDLASLQGVTMATVQYVPGDIVLRYVLSKENITPNFVEYLTPADALNALESGEVPIALLWEPYVSLAEFRNLTVVMWDKEFYPEMYPCCLQVFTKSFVQSHPDLVVKFIRALIKAEKYAYEDPYRAALLAKKYIPGVPAELIYKCSLYVDPKLGRARNPVSALIDMPSLQKFTKMMVEVGFISQKTGQVLLERVDLKYFKQAVDQLKKEGFQLPWSS